MAMDCQTAQTQLLDALDGALDSAQKSALDDHLSRCASCRAEMRRLREGLEAVRLAAEELAPRQRYLTTERLGRLMVAYGRKTRVVSLHLPRGLVAAAAVAAICVSAVVIALSMRAPSALPPAARYAATEAPYGPALPVVLTTVAPGEPMRTIRPVTLGPLGARSEGQAGRLRPFVPISNPGLIVPADHTLYDPEESSRWW